MLTDSKKQEIEQLVPLLHSADEDEDLLTDDPVPVWVLSLFAVVGIQNVLLLNSIWIELPYFQQDLTKWLANEMTVAGAMGAIVVVPIFLCIDRGWDINYHHLLY